MDVYYVDGFEKYNGGYICFLEIYGELINFDYV